MNFIHKLKIKIEMKLRGKMLLWYVDEVAFPDWSVFLLNHWCSFYQRNSFYPADWLPISKDLSGLLDLCCLYWIGHYLSRVISIHRDIEQEQRNAVRKSWCHFWVRKLCKHELGRQILGKEPKAIWVVQKLQLSVSVGSMDKFHTLFG
jgi:hypothetical protein